MSNLNLAKMKEEASKKEAIDLKAVLTEDDNAKEVVEKVKKQYVDRELKFEVSYESDEGLKKTTLVSKILDSEGRLRQDKILMRLCDGYAFDDYPTDTKTRFQCLARIVSQLKEPPEWVLEAVGMDMEFCYHLATRLVEHETRYFRDSSNESGGEKKPQRFSIDFPELA
tara:strand:- start:8749 stop:9255 length:507 start_codon:yes stop_codon:yes gene_type:complete